MAKKVKKSNGLRLIILAILVLISSVLILQKSKSSNYCANSLSCQESLELSVDNGVSAVFNGQSIVPPQINLDAEKGTKVLAQAAGLGEKHIYVDIATQTLTAVEGDEVFMQVPVSTGLWGKTPTGEFDIWLKVRSTKMSGGSGADYYYLPNVPFVMFFEGSGIAAGRGFSLHGAYWHNNFGHPMSHGCVNMRTRDAEKLFDWVAPISSEARILSSEENPGTKITIYGEYPQ